MRLVLAVLLVSIVVSGGSSTAAPGLLSDPDDVASIVDIRQIAHSDTPTNVSYVLEWYEAVGDANWVCDIVWDFNGDGLRDGSVQFALEFGPSAAVYNTQGNEVAQASVQRSAPNAVTVTVPLVAMGLAGLAPGATSYQYFGSCRQNTPQVDDDTNPTTHTLGGTVPVGNQPVLNCPAAWGVGALPPADTITVTASDADVGSSVTLSENGPATLTQSGTNPVTGTLTYDPNILDWFTDFVTPVPDQRVTATDNTGLIRTCTILIDVVLFPGSPF